MNEERRIHFRIAILRALDAAHPMKLTSENVHLAVCLRCKATQSEVERELHDLADKQLTKSAKDPLNSAVTLWSRTEEGRALLAEYGLAMAE